MTISLPLSLLAARNLSTTGISSIESFRFLEVHALIWAIFFVILIGFGPISGILAMTVYTVGYLRKLQYEAIEDEQSSLGSRRRA